MIAFSKRFVRTNEGVEIRLLGHLGPLGQFIKIPERLDYFSEWRSVNHVESNDLERSC